MDYQKIIDKYYLEDNELKRLLIRHSHDVAHRALLIADRNPQIALDRAFVEEAAMLHDIGIFITDAPGIHCHGTAPYLTHGRLGADLLRSEGAPEEIARVAERHTGTGLTPADILRFGGLLPDDRSYMPTTLLELLICYADKFFSKNGDMQEKTIERIRASLAKFGPDSVERFETMHSKFATPEFQ